MPLRILKGLPKEANDSGEIMESQKKNTKHLEYSKAEPVRFAVASLKGLRSTLTTTIKESDVGLSEVCSALAGIEGAIDCLEEWIELNGLKRL